MDIMNYVWKDLLASLRFLPYGLLIGVPLACLLAWSINRKRNKKGKGKANWIKIVLLCCYLGVMFAMTFLLREPGGGKGPDFDLFSSWRINNRNRALVIENVLLFIPYGFLVCLQTEKMRTFPKILLCGFLTSTCIEVLQWVTQRGFFQLDDIVTNVLGTILGFAVYKLFRLVADHALK